MITAFARRLAKLFAVDGVIGKAAPDQLAHALFASPIRFGDRIEDLVALVFDRVRRTEERQDGGARGVGEGVGEGEQARDVVIHARALSTMKTGPPCGEPVPPGPPRRSLRRGGSEAA